MLIAESAAARDVMVGGEGGAESPRNRRNQRGEEPLATEVAPIRPSGPMATLFTGYGTFVLALKMSSGTPVDENRMTPGPLDVVPITMRPFESSAIDLTSLFVGRSAADPAPPSAGYRKTLVEVPPKMVPFSGSIARAVNAPLMVKSVSSSPVLDKKRFIP